MAYFLLSVLGALAYNLPLLILGIVAVVKASKGKSYFGWLVAGCVVQVPALIGGYQFTFNSDSSTMEVETYISPKKILRMLGEIDETDNLQ